MVDIVESGVEVVFIQVISKLRSSGVFLRWLCGVVGSSFVRII